MRSRASSRHSIQSKLPAMLGALLIVVVGALTRPGYRALDGRRGYAA